VRSDVSLSGFFRILNERHKARPIDTQTGRKYQEENKMVKSPYRRCFPESNADFQILRRRDRPSRRLQCTTGTHYLPIIE
jgi:hypothetical protein